MYVRRQEKQAFLANTDKKAFYTKTFSATHPYTYICVPVYTYNFFFLMREGLVQKMNLT